MAAREGILNRRMIVEMRKGRIRLGDWNRVNTTAGFGMEPRCPQFLNPFSFDQGAAVDLDDCINRIDGIDWDWDWRDPFYRCPLSNMALIGGYVNLGRHMTFSDDAVIS